MVIDTAALCAELVYCLESRKIPDAAFDVRCMFEQVTGQPYERLLLTGLPSGDEKTLRDMVQRRTSGEPLQYILGEWEFYGMRLFVGMGVLIPRPDTEMLVDTVLQWCKGKNKLRILDLCTGSGCIALALQKHLPDAEVHAVEYSEAAYAFAQKNIAYHDLPVTLHHGDVLHPATAAQFHDFDVIVSNPPYLTAEEMTVLQTEVQHEPAQALDGGADGLVFYREITRLWKNILCPDGLLAYEIGETQGQAVTDILEHEGFRNIQVIQDFAYHERVVIGRR